MFGPCPFDTMNETDVREMIVAPLLQKLGYRKGTANDVITEQVLRYPKISMGRKKPNDPSLRGKADYILEVDERLRWTIEAKSPEKSITVEDREQAYTYAIHPEVKAIFFVLTNGRIIELFHATEAPQASAIFHCTYEELATHFDTLNNIVGPTALKRDFAKLTLDVGKPLAPGLRSFAKLVHGQMIHRTCKPQLPGPNMIGITGHFSEGSIERIPTGGLLCYFKVSGPYVQLNDYAQAIGFEVIELTSSDETLSSDPHHPTRFSGEHDWTISRGSTIPDIMTGKSVFVPFDMCIQTRSVALGSLRNGKFTGTYDLQITITSLRVAITGDFEAQLE